MIYIEYVSRRAGVDIRDFHAGLLKGQAGWGESYQEDQLVWSAGRTWRMGPEPEYVVAWYSPRQGLERIDAWDRVFRSGEVDPFEAPARRVSRIDAAGCYEPLLEPVAARGGTYYAEYFRARGELPPVRSFYEQRAQRHPRFTLNLLVHRIGRLGPEPGGLAVWTVPNFASLAEIVEELGAARGPIEVTAAGTYADIGQEIL